MVDPIEIIDKVFTVAKTIYTVVKSIKGAPDELKGIDRAVSRVLPVLEHLFETLGQRVQAEDRNRDARALQSLCDEARELVDRAHGFLKTDSDGVYTLRKKEWPRWLLKKADREDLTKRFHDLHGSVSAYLSFDSHREMRQLQALKGEVDSQSVELRSIHADVQEVRSDLARYHAQQSQHNDQIRYTVVQCMMRSAAQSQTQELNQYYDEVTSDNTDFTDSTLIRRSTTAHWTHSEVLSNCSGPCTRTRNTDASHGTPCSDICPPSCRCRCHQPPITPIPQFLRSVVGSISIDHDVVSGLRSIFTPCNEQRCRRHRSNLLKIKYYCPTWFAQIDAEIRTERIPVHFIIQTSRVVDIAWLEWATLDEVRQKLCSRELTVNDVRPNGFSVLHTVTTRLIWDRSDTALSIVALLTEHSAPTDWECKGLTPTEHALWWSLVYWRCYESRTAAINALRHRLGPYLPQDIDDAYEELAPKLRWTGLHRLIYLFSSPALTSIPPELASQVNIKDSFGRTPLFYAALVRPEVIHALLVAGANLRIDRTILSWAGRAGADSVIGMLVRAGALPNASSGVEGRTTLHWAAHPNLTYAINSLAVALELVRHAGHILDWDARDEDGDTPLDWVQMRVRRNPNDADSKRILGLYQTRQLPDGAQYIPAPPIVDMEDDSAGDDSTGLPPTSLIRAGLRGDVDAIGNFISRGAMVNERDQDGRTLLHLVALGKVPDGYRVALELVRHGGWGVDWDALVGRREQDDNNEAQDEDYKAGIREGDGSEELEKYEQVQVTALEIAQARLDRNELTEQEREELEKICDLLEARRLPAGETYLWPCMDPDLYIPKPLPTFRIPGAWEDE